MRPGEREEAVALARRMRHFGVPLEIPEEDQEDRHRFSDGLRIRQVGAVAGTTAFDLSSGGTGYILDIILTSNIEGPFSVSSFGLELSWTDSSFAWLPDPLQGRSPDEFYRFPGRDQLWYGRDQVINHRADLRCTLCRGHSLQGLLLGFGRAPIPADVVHGQMVEAVLSITDQFGRTRSSPLCLWADRSQQYARRSKKKREREPLFAKPDVECPDTFESS